MCDKMSIISIIFSFNLSLPRNKYQRSPRCSMPARVPFSPPFRKVKYLASFATALQRCKARSTALSVDGYRTELSPREWASCYLAHRFAYFEQNPQSGIRCSVEHAKLAPSLIGCCNFVRCSAAPGCRFDHGAKKYRRGCDVTSRSFHHGFRGAFAPVAASAANCSASFKGPWGERKGTAGAWPVGNDACSRSRSQVAQFDHDCRSTGRRYSTCTRFITQKSGRASEKRKGSWEGKIPCNRAMALAHVREYRPEGRGRSAYIRITTQKLNGASEGSERVRCQR